MKKSNARGRAQIINLIHLTLLLLIFSQLAVSAADEDVKTRPKIALALGGGGARCAAHIGVLRELEKAHIKVDYIVGCSMGAIIGGLYCSGMPVDKIEEFVLKKDGLFRALIPSPVAMRFIGHSPAFVAHAAHLPKSIGLYSGKELGIAIDRLVGPDHRKIENLPIAFAAVATDLTDGSVVVIKDGDLGDAVQASSAVPGLFRASSVYEDRLLIDGGLRANVPARQARATGADIVIAVNADETLSKIDPAKFKQFAVLSNRLVSILLDSIDEHQLESADFVIRPGQAGVSLYSRKASDMQISIKAGADATAAMVGKIKERIGPQNTQ